MTPKGAWPRSRVLLLKQWDRYPCSTERISCFSYLFSFPLPHNFPALLHIFPQICHVLLRSVVTFTLLLSFYHRFISSPHLSYPHLIFQYLFRLHVDSILILPVSHLLFFQLLLAHVPIAVAILSFLPFFFSVVILSLILFPPISLYAHLIFAPFLQILTLPPYLVFSLSSS